MVCLIKLLGDSTFRKTGIERALARLIKNIVTEITLIGIGGGRETD